MSPNSKSSMPKTIKTERKSETTVKSKNIDATSVDAGNNPVKEFQSSRDVIEKKIDAFFEANKDAGIRKLVSATKLMEAGAHIGTYARYSNPKMKPFVYPKRAGKSLVIDILKTLVYLDRAYQFLRDITKDGARVLFVGTRGDVIKEHVKNEAKRVQSFYVNQR
jgi:small subunit ribosomal protein S2